MTALGVQAAGFDALGEHGERVGRLLREGLDPPQPVLVVLHRLERQRIGEAAGVLDALAGAHRQQVPAGLPLVSGRPHLPLEEGEVQGGGVVEQTGVDRLRPFQERNGVGVPAGHRFQTAVVPAVVGGAVAEVAGVLGELAQRVRPVVGQQNIQFGFRRAGGQIFGRDDFPPVPHPRRDGHFEQHAGGEEEQRDDERRWERQQAGGGECDADGAGTEHRRGRRVRGGRAGWYAAPLPPAPVPRPAVFPGQRPRRP